MAYERTITVSPLPEDLPGFLLYLSVTVDPTHYTSNLTFTDASGTVTLPHYLYSYASGTFKVFVRANLSASGTTIRMVYS